MEPKTAIDLDCPQAFQGGDVVFHTSTELRGIFVLHKSVLAANSKYFSSLFSESWGTEARALADAELPVYELDLQFDRTTGFALPIRRVSRVLQSQTLV